MMVAQATAILAGAVEPAEAFGSKRAVGAPAALAVENLAVAALAVRLRRLWRWRKDGVRSPRGQLRRR